MIFFSKMKAWIKAHWNWLVLVGLFCLAYALGKKGARGLLAQAEAAKEQYKAESEAIERAARARCRSSAVTRISRGVRGVVHVLFVVRVPSLASGLLKALAVAG